MTQKVCAVVVTYNRKELLSVCLDSILNQTRPADAIIIVDNCSSDGTPQYLMEKGYINEPPPQELSVPWTGKFVNPNTPADTNSMILYVRMNCNTGSAGGFYEGIKTGYEAGYDWLWLMDDDGKPEPDALQKLSDASAMRPDGMIFNSIVIDKQDKDKISFVYQYGFNVSDIEKGTCNRSAIFSLKDLKTRCSGICDGLAQFFNSTLIHRNAIEAAGYPVREFFIRGEEEEYVFRMQCNGLRTYTVPDSIIYHPSPRTRQVSFLGRELKYEEMSDFKKYYSIRNRLWQARFYPKIVRNRSILKAIASEIIFALKDKKSISQTVSSIKVIINAYRDSAGLIKKVDRRLRHE